MELASVLQTRNMALEHQVNELHDTNASLIEDVQWHLEAVSKLEDVLKEAQIEKAATFKEVLDLDARLTRAQDGAGSAITPPSASIDSEATESDMADSDGFQSGKGVDLDILRHLTSIGDARSLPRVHRKCAGDERARSFYFSPRAALILLESSPRRPYQFLRGSTLYQIHRDLVRRCNRDSADDPIFQILEILGMREYLGIWLPDTVRDEVIKIGVPYLDKIPDADDDIPLVAWEVFNDANEEFNVEGWEDWYDAVQSSAYPSLRPGDSNPTVQEDAAEIFDDWSWDVDHSGEVSRSVEMSPRTRPRIHHIVPIDDDQTPCLRGGIGNDSRNNDGTVRAQVDVQCCSSPKGHLYHKLSEDNFSAHWPQE